MSTPVAQHPPAPGPIPAPPDFPIRWENPGDESMFWTRDVLHYPDQMSPLQISADEEAWLFGWRSGAAAYDMPVVGLRILLINTYYYCTMVPVIAPPEEMAARGHRLEQKVRAAMDRLRELWECEWLPEVNEHIAYLKSFDSSAASLSDLRSHLEESISRFKRLAEIHYLLTVPMAFAVSLFDDLYRDLFGSSGAFDAYQLLSGFDNKTLESGRELRQLGRKAHTVPEVARALQNGSAGEVLAALRTSESGKAFLAELDAYLLRFGDRGDKFNIDYPSWQEDPTPVINYLRDFAGRTDSDPTSNLETLASEREKLLARARARLTGYPAPLVTQFEALLKTAQFAYALSENHGFYLEFPLYNQVRRLFLEFGRRFLEAGVLDVADDVFFLTLDELRETAAALPEINRRGQVRERKAEKDRFRNITPPPVLGTPPPGPPPDNPFTTVIFKAFGGAPQPPTEPNIIRGNAGSPGKVQGTARVIHQLSEAHKLRPGEVLVAETTLPPWTPLFATAAAVVADGGGVLSHAAVVAREYRIPAVVGTGLATKMIRDGQLVEVDGEAGLVRILSQAECSTASG